MTAARPKPPSPEVAIIRTRLAPPRVGSAPVSRDKLLQRLHMHRSRKLSLVLGPAGSGKTMLLAQWRKQLIEQGAKVAWYNMGTDEDVTQVAAYVVEGLRSAGLEIRTDELHLFNRSGGKTRNSFLASLVDDLLDCEAELYLIIDDIHHGTAFNTFQLLDAFIDALPENVHLVFGSRTRPLLNLLKLQTQEQLVEIDFKDLRFDLEETGKFVSAQGLTNLAPLHIRRLHEMSDGWAAGLQLLLFSLRKESQPEHFFTRHAGEPSISQEGALVSYLESNVADYISTEELDFLCVISVCRRFNRPLCEVLTGNPRASEFLKKFESEQLFLLPIDTPEVDPWYRLHNLFRDFLQSRLEQKDKAQVKELYEKTARWFASQRLYLEALRYAGEGGHTHLIVDLIDRSARRMAAEGYFRQLIKLCDQVPKESLRDRLNICLNLAWAQISCGHFDAFQENMEAMLHHSKNEEASVQYEVQLLRAYGCSALDDTAEINRIVEPMLQQELPDDVFLLSLISSLACAGFVFAGRFAESREAIRFFYKRLRPGQKKHKNFLADTGLGNAYLAEGRIRDALAHLMPFKEEILLRGKVGPDALGNMIGALCEALLQFNRLDDTRELLETYAEMINAAELPEGILKGHRTRAQLELLANRPQAAFQTLRRLEEIGIQRRLDRLVAWSLHDQLMLSMRSQHPSSSDEILQRLAQLAEKYAGHENCAWAQIPMIYAQASAENAVYRQANLLDCLQLIDVAEDLWRKINRHAILIRLGFLRCIAHLAAGKQQPALSEASELLSKAAELGTLRILADFGPIARPLVKLLLGRAHRDTEHEIVEIALTSPNAPQTCANGASESADTLAEPLTAREIEVLELLGKGFSAKSIGRSLDISPTTAKWHLKNVYGKLDALSREDALARARQFRIIR